MPSVRARKTTAKPKTSTQGLSRASRPCEALAQWLMTDVMAIYHLTIGLCISFLDDEVRALEEGGYGTAEEQRADDAVEREEELERLRAEEVAYLVLELIADGLQHEGEEDNHPQPVGTAEAGGIEQGEGGEEGSAEGDERGEGELNLLQHDVDLHGEHGGEEDEEEEEREHNARRMEVADGHPCGQHVLNGPGLTSELGHEPAALRGDVGQRHEGDGQPVVPGGQSGDVVAVGFCLRQQSDGASSRR